MKLDEDSFGWLSGSSMRTRCFWPVLVQQTLHIHPEPKKGVTAVPDAQQSEKAGYGCVVARVLGCVARACKAYSIHSHHKICV